MRDYFGLFENIGRPWWLAFFFVFGVVGIALVVQWDMTTREATRLAFFAGLGVAVVVRLFFWSRERRARAGQAAREASIREGRVRRPQAGSSERRSRRRGR